MRSKPTRMTSVPRAWREATIEGDALTDEGARVVLFKFREPHLHGGELCQWGARVILPMSKIDAWMACPTLEQLHEEIQDTLEAEVLSYRRPADSWQHVMQ